MFHRAGPFHNLRAIPGLRPAGYLPNHLLFCTDGTFVYGTRNTGQIKRWRYNEIEGEGTTLGNWLTDFSETGYDAPNRFLGMHVCHDGSILAEIGIPPTAAPTETHHFIYRSVDQGQNWSAFRLRPGLNGGTHEDDFRSLGESSYANVTLANGTKAVLFGEYTVNDTVAAGFLNVYISTDNGDTWSVFWRLNNTTDNYRHVHGIQQNEYTGEILIHCGDAGDEAALINGPAIASWSAIDDTPPANVGAVPGFAIQYGSQRNRGFEGAFRRGWIHYSSDTKTTTEDGFWKYPYDLSTDGEQTYDDPYLADTDLAGAPSILQLRNGKMFAMDYVASIPSTPVLRRIWGSGDGETWAHVANVQIQSGVSDVFPSHWFELPDGRIVISGKTLPGAVTPPGDLETAILQPYYDLSPNDPIPTLMPESPAP